MNVVPFAQNITKEKNHCLAQCPPQHIWNPPTHQPLKIRHFFPRKIIFRECNVQRKAEEKKFKITSYSRDLGFPDFLVIKGEKIQTLEKKNWFCFGGHALVKCFVSTTVRTNEWRKEQRERREASGSGFFMAHSSVFGISFSGTLTNGSDGAMSTCD